VFDTAAGAVATGVGAAGDVPLPPPHDDIVIASAAPAIARRRPRTVEFTTRMLARLIRAASWLVLIRRDIEELASRYTLSGCMTSR
jgi:hypothetical protein